LSGDGKVDREELVKFILEIARKKNILKEKTEKNEDKADNSENLQNK